MRASRLEQIVKARFGAHPPPRLWRNESAARLCAGDERIAAGFLICRPKTALAGTGPAGVPYDDSSRSCGSSSGGAHFTPIPAPADWPVEKRARWLGAGAKIGEKQPCVSASLLSAWR
jgi:hypothetical protein